MSKSTVLSVAEEFQSINQIFFYFIDHLKTIISENEQHFKIYASEDETIFYFKYLHNIFGIKLSVIYDEADSYYFGELYYKKITEWTMSNSFLRSLKEEDIEHFQEGESFSFPNKIEFYVSGKLKEPNRKIVLKSKEGAEDIFFKWLHNYIRSEGFGR